MADIQFIGHQGTGTPPEETEMELEERRADEEENPRSPFPEPILEIPENRMVALKSHIESWLTSLKASHEAKVDEYARQEAAYRAQSEGPRNTPFVGANGDVVPVIAMAVDPIHARLDTGIFKASPVFRFKGLKKSVLPYIDALEQWVEYYQKHRLKFRSVASPRLLEMTKHGTMIFKTVYEHETYKVKGYNKEWEVVEKDITTFRGPKVYGISIQDLLFPAGYQHLNDCPFIAERIRSSYSDLRKAEESNKLKNVDKLRGQEKNEKDSLRTEREISANHEDGDRTVSDRLELWEIWMDFPLYGDKSDDTIEGGSGSGIADRIVVTYHEGTGEILQLRYNWYFHQRKPYTLIPYQITNDSVMGLGICEMTMFFQDAQTKWHRMATDNAYLANIRMFIAKRNSDIEEVPKLYTGRVFFVDNPQTDFVPFATSDVYGSTLSERQNLFGLAEKRTGVSDYLTGRESPIVGSRATATSTVALIQEGTRRVEEVLENVRNGFSEIMQMCMYLWIQYGLDGVDDVVFGDDQIGQLIKDFFDKVDEDNIAGMLAIDLSATDAANNKAVQQQVQLAIIQTMMQYLDKLVQSGQLALQAAATAPALTQMIGDVMKSARKMFLDLLTKYDIRNPEDYLPELETYLASAVAEAQAPAGGSPEGGSAGGTGGLDAQSLAAISAGQATNPAAAFAERVGVGDPNAPIPSAPG